MTKLHDLGARAEAMRQFNRFYTRCIGVLHEHPLDGEFSLTELRVLYELAHRQGVTGADLCRELGLNAGYLSRLISGLEKKRLVHKQKSASDARVAQLQLTDKGRQSFEPLDELSQCQVMAVLDTLSEPQQAQLVGAMRQIEGLLGDAPTSYLLRDPQVGDMGWIVHRQSVLYAQEYGWNNEYEALASEIVARFVREFDPKSERCWIAEQAGQVVGSVFVVRQDDATAKLRLLYVDPTARGMGIGRRLVEECLRFARHAGYQRMVLWTNSVLVAARHIYEKAGFQLVEEESHHSFGKDLVGQTWRRDL